MSTETETEAHRASDASPPRPAARGVAAADEKQQEWLRRSLKKLYEDTAQDPIPDSFIELLEELDRKEREGK
ncbi:MAG: NepR family anti-sigma factor [Alphaproteobacteria bacterium]